MPRMASRCTRRSWKAGGSTTSGRPIPAACAASCGGQAGRTTTRMRVRGTTGSVAGAANYNCGLAAHSVLHGLPVLALPKPPVPVPGPYVRALRPIKMTSSADLHPGTTPTERTPDDEPMAGFPRRSSGRRRCGLARTDASPELGERHSRRCSGPGKTLPLKGTNTQSNRNSCSAARWPIQRHVPRQPESGLPDQRCLDDLRRPHGLKGVSRRPQAFAEQLVGGLHS
jgi:hypothetical protein